MKSVIIALLCMGSAALAGSSHPLEVLGVTTTSQATASTDQSGTINGEVSSIELAIRDGNTNGLTIAVTTVTNEAHRVAKTLLTLSAQTANAVFYPRILVENNAGTDATDAWTAYDLVGETVELSVSDATADGTNTDTSVDVRINLIVE